MFVVVTAALVVDTVESEINEIWGIRRKRPLMRRVVVYVVGVTAGPVLVGAAITAIMWLLRLSVATVPLQQGAIRAILQAAAVPVRDGRLHAALRGRARAPGRVAARAHRRRPRRRRRSRRRASGSRGTSRTRRRYEILYGALAAVPIFLLWIFVFWMIVLAGAAVTASLADARGDR